MTAWLADALIGSGLLLAGVLLLRSPVRRLFGPRVAYALWALPALRLVLPPLPSWPVDAIPVALGRETILVLVAAPEAAPAFPIAAMLTTVWAGGAVALVAWHVVRHYRFTQAILDRAEPVAVIGGIRIVLSAAASGPLAFGLWRRIVALPRDWDSRYDREERAMALAHEIAHHRRGDLLAGACALVVLACHWFNPLAWAAARAFRVDQELATDAHVLARTDRTLRASYAAAILKTVRGPAPRTIACLHTVSDLKGRLKMLALAPASRRRLATGSAAVCALVTAGLLATASGTPAAATLADRVETTVAQITPPAPPVPPAPVAGVKKIHRIVVTRNGETKVYEGADADAYVAANPVPRPGAKQRKRVVVMRDGKAETYEGVAADAYLAEHPLPAPPAPTAPPLPPSATLDASRAAERVAAAMRAMPTIVSGPCRRGPGGSLSANAITVTRIDGGKRLMVVCTDRIAAAANRAQFAAAGASRFQRDALRGALEALRRTRDSMASGRGFEQLTPEQRARALTGMDSSIAEMERDSAERN